MLNGSLFVLSSKRVSGIYTITNIQNGKVYIGESLDIYRRWHEEHLPSLRGGVHHNKSLQEDFDKYGESNFRFEILHRYSDESTIITKARILILESYYIKAFEKSNIELYNAENTLVEILRGRKVPNEGTVLIMNIVKTLSEYAPKLCEGIVYFDKRNTIENIFLEYANFKEKNKNTAIKEFKEFLFNNGITESNVCEIRKINYVLNGREHTIETKEVKDKFIKEIIRKVIKFENRKIDNKDLEGVRAKKDTKEKTVDKKADRKYEPIKENEVRFSNLFSKLFVKNEILPEDNDYTKIRNYLVSKNIIEIKYLTMPNGMESGVTFATEYSLDNDILRIVGETKRGNNVIPNLVFTTNGINAMTEMFKEIDNDERFKMFKKDAA